MKYNAKNERIKKQFFEWLTEAEGLNDKTCRKIEQAIFIYQREFSNDDFSLFNSKKAILFKDTLRSQKTKQGKVISLSLFSNHLRFLTKFFTWLSRENGYRKIKAKDVDYLKISRKENNMLNKQKIREFPNLEYVKNLASSIVPDTEVNKRDQALISFTLLTGMRDSAIASLPLGCVDEDSMTVNQDPCLGVQTKFSKNIHTIIFNFDDVLVQYVLNWVKYLKVKGFQREYPLFPRSKSNQTTKNLSFQKAMEISIEYWKGAGQIRQIFKKHSQRVGVMYYPPHTFRHTAIDLALKSCNNTKEMKAVSQSFGHKDVATTLEEYANYDVSKLNEIIQNIDFSGKKEKSKEKQIKEITKIVLAQIE